MDYPHYFRALNLCCYIFGKNKIYAEKYKSFDSSLIVFATISLLSTLIMLILTIELFGGGDYRSVIDNTSLIRTARFNQSIEGAPILYSIVEYVAYMYIGTVSVAIFRPSKSSIPVLLIALLSAVIMTLAYASRTPLILFALSIMLSGLLKIGIPTVIRFMVRPLSLILIFTFWFGGNFLASVRDDGVKISFDRINYSCGGCFPEDNFVIQGGVSNLLYSATSLANLNDILSGPVLDKPLLGLATFSGFVTPLRKFGVDVPIDDQATSKGGLTNQNVFSHRAVYNTYSAFRDLIRDFGVSGSLIEFFALYLVGTACCSQFSAASYARKFWAAMFLFWCAASPFTNAYGSLGKAIISGFMVVIIIQISSNFKSIIPKISFRKVHIR